MVPPQVSSVARKPLSIAFEEIAEHKILWTEAPVEEEPEFDPEAEAQAMADAAEFLAAGDD
jgi:DNA-directed RNA polymerase subunit omega